MRTHNRESQTSGLNRRHLLVSGGATAAAAVLATPAIAKPDLAGAKKPKEIWGPRVPLEGLPNLYAPQEFKPRTVVDAGVDHLGLHSTDVFEISRFGAGIFEVDFNGYFRVARGKPTTKNWTDFRVQVNITELRLRGSHPELGPITVRLNKDIVSVGEIFPAKSAEEDAQCRIATAVTFEVPNLGTTLFNKEPILLMNNHVKGIPPVNDPTGQALLYKLPLFDVADPDGIPLGYLTSLKYGADEYLTPLQVKTVMEG